METLEPLSYDLTFPPVEDGTEVIMGDVNRDGKVDIDDATEVQKLCASFYEADEVQQVLGDVDGDQRIDINEATRIQRCLVEQPADAFTNNIGKSFLI